MKVKTIVFAADVLSAKIKERSLSSGEVLDSDLHADARARQRPFP